jgi:uncharacterized protein (DUF1499 family)
MKILQIFLLIVVSGLCAQCVTAGDGGPAPCPDRPNCVSSRSAPEHRSYIAPLAFSGPADAAWRRITALVADLPRVAVVKQSDTELHAECRSAVFGFVDDLELTLDPARSVIHVRSAARTGYFDFGVNRRRVEALRQRFVP